jgi:SAM-dependent methyltransferase
MTYGSDKSFNDAMHAAGAWDTRMQAARGPLVRTLVDILSLKRGNLDRMLRRITAAQPRLLEVGCGKGAYATWALQGKTIRLVALDISYTALRSWPGSDHRVVRVCADAAHMPFKPDVFDGVYSIDTLGHVADVTAVLDEIGRSARAGATLFVHSECSDYQRRWPARMLIAKTGYDALAVRDGHYHLHDSRWLYRAYASRFELRSFFSPAGILGWLCGYPEKYRDWFARADCKLLQRMSAVGAWIKMLPLSGVLLRLCNVMSNRAELFLGLRGGGSCFVHARVPVRGEAQSPAGAVTRHLTARVQDREHNRG